jgi:DNA end-binding protein Ku
LARAIWTGVISFGLVAVPVALYSATEEHEVSFHQFEKDSTDRIRYKRVNERTDQEVDYDDIVKGADVGGGHYVMLDQDELDSVAPGRSRSLEIQTFVDVDEVDPIHFQKTYYLGPRDGETAKTYALLRDAMAKSGKAAVGTFVMRGKEYLALVRADGDLLVLETMYFADELRDAKKEVADIPGSVSGRGKELKMAQELIGSMTGKWRPADYRDTYTDRVNDLIEAKRHDHEITVADEAPKPTKVIDLMDALQRSVEGARGGKAAAGKPRREATRVAKKDAAKNKSAKRTSQAKDRKAGSDRRKKAS